MCQNQKVSNSWWFSQFEHYQNSKRRQTGSDGFHATTIMNKLLGVLKIGHQGPHYCITFDIMQRYTMILQQFINLRDICIPYILFYPIRTTGFAPLTVWQVLAQHTFTLQFEALTNLADHQQLRIVNDPNIHHETS